MDYNKINKMDKFFQFCKDNQKRWQAKAKIDYSQIRKTKKMNSMQKHRLDNDLPKYEEIQGNSIYKPRKEENPDRVDKYIICEGVKFFNSDYIDPKYICQECNTWIQKDWIWDLRNPRLTLSDCRKIIKYLLLDIVKIEHKITGVNESDSSCLIGSVMIHYKVICAHQLYWEKIKKYFEPKK